MTGPVRFEQRGRRDLGVALIGCGRVVVEAYLDALRALPGLRVRAVCDLDGHRAKRVAEALGHPVLGIDALTDVNSSVILDSELVLVALPPSACVEVVRSALARGQSVLTLL